jgi:hypothetical protein
MKGLRKTTKNLIVDSRSPVGDLIPEPAEYEIKVKPHDSDVRLVPLIQSGARESRQYPSSLLFSRSVRTVSVF